MGAESLLIIFAKNPVLGKVKTRLAVSIGEEKALNIYIHLLELTLLSSEDVSAKKEIWFSDGTPSRFQFDAKKFVLKVQIGKDLGERMELSFREGFENNYSKAIIIGTDCPGITKEIIEDAFFKLDENDVVIGPANDGGYYLLGMKKLHSQLFQTLPWSSSQLLNETIHRINDASLSYELLPALSDIDTLEDFSFYPELKKKYFS